jgi:hypothetical protein
MGRRLQYYFSDDKCPNSDEYRYDDLNHQKSGHHLPTQGIYTREEMVKESRTYFKAGDYYEVSVLCMILSRWEKEYCHFRYD